MRIPDRLLPLLSQFTIEVSPDMLWCVVEKSLGWDLLRVDKTHIELLADDLDALAVSFETEEELVSALIEAGCYYWPGEGVSYRSWLRMVADGIRKKARGETAEESYWRKVEPYWEAVSIYDGADKFLGEYAALPEASQVLFAAHWLQSEVRNGGFFQFFENSTGVLAPEAVAAFEKLGMKQCAGIIKKAMEPYGSLYPRESEARLSAPDECWDEEFLDELSCKFFQCIEAEGGGFNVVANAYAKRT